MNQSVNIGRLSSTSTDENSHSINNAAALSLQAFVDDIPFEFNPKYRTIFVSNSDIPEYDTIKIRDILSKPIDLTLENKVLLEALEDLQRKKKEFQADTLRQQASTVITNGPTINPLPVVSNTLPHPITHSLTHVPNSQLFPLMPTISPSYRLPSVRDIYWPTGNPQQYVVPVNGPTTVTSNMLTLPTPIRSTSLIKTTNRSLNNCDSIAANDLTATFDGTFGSDDPFHDAELKSLNDVAELRHLYSTIGSGNTVRR